MFTMRNDQNAGEGKWSQVAAMCISPLVFWPGSQVTRQAALAEEERNKVCLVKLFGFSGWLETVFLSVVFFLLNPWNLFGGTVTLLNGKMEPIVHIWLEISYSFREKRGWWGGRTRWTVVIGGGLHAFLRDGPRWHHLADCNAETFPKITKFIYVSNTLWILAPS